ncbi:glycosyltransferase family 2 protein [Sphingomonas sp. ID0503]|uniref:glycosyltransferase family 2 protein n=1 Tax=Sphingomonas sp. ID0503 TaxID=3399691 RepID=UPI003AFA78F8
MGRSALHLLRRLLPARRPSRQDVFPELAALLSARKDGNHRAMFTASAGTDAAVRNFARLLIAVDYLMPEVVLPLSEAWLTPRQPSPIRRFALEKRAVALAKLGHHHRALETLAEARSEGLISPRSLQLITANLLRHADPARALETLRGVAEPNHGYRLLTLILTLELEGPDAAAKLIHLDDTSAEGTFARATVAAGRDRTSHEEAIADAFRTYGLAAPTLPKTGEYTADAILNPEGLEQHADGPLVTLIVTAHNAAATLTGAVASLQQQTHGNLEILIVDDLSTDPTAEIAMQIADADPRVRVLRNRSNIGTYLSRNRAIAQAKGEFVTFHDSDDWSHPERIARHLAMMVADERLMVTKSKWVRMLPDGSLSLRRWTRSFLHVNPSSLFIRTDAFPRIGWFDAVRADADFELSRRIDLTLPNEAVATIDAPLAIGFIRPISITAAGPLALDREHHSPVRSAYKQAWTASYPARMASGTLPLPPCPAAYIYDVPPSMRVDLAGVADWFDARD